MSEHHVRALFDQRAQRFEAELAGLGYRGAQLLRRAVETVAGAGVRFERMIDLGCGTGLAATAFAALCRTAVGIDLSSAMIEIARRKGLAPPVTSAPRSTPPASRSAFAIRPPSATKAGSRFPGSSS